MSSHRFTRTPRALPRRGVKLDNLALTPASLLPYKKHWQSVPNHWLQSDTLIVLLSPKRPQRIALAVVCHLFPA
jgi:hypothetical protein